MSNSVLRIEGLEGGPRGKRVLKGIDLEVSKSEIVAIMGPNGSGKSTLVHLLMGRPGYEIKAGRIWVNDVDVTEMPTYERARAGLFVGFQYPTELPGIRLADLMSVVLPVREEVENGIRHIAGEVGMNLGLLERGLNDDFSGGEKKRAEIVQMQLLSPTIAVLDEIDSGLDVDALAAVAEQIRSAASRGTGVLLITHYKLLLQHVPPSQVHILVDGIIERSGGPELAEELEVVGYER